METLPAKEAAAAAVPSVMTGCVPEKGDSPCSPSSPLSSFLVALSGVAAGAKDFSRVPPSFPLGLPPALLVCPPEEIEAEIDALSCPTRTLISRVRFRLRGSFQRERAHG